MTSAPAIPAGWEIEGGGSAIPPGFTIESSPGSSAVPIGAHPNPDSIGGYFAGLPDTISQGWRTAKEDISDLYQGWRNDISPPDQGARPAIPTPEQAVRILAEMDTRVPETGNPVYDKSLPIEQRIRLLQEQEARRGAAWDEEKGFRDSRTMAQRATDTAAYGLSMPVRMVSQGKAGLGDVMTAAGLPAAGQLAGQSEANFARANQGSLAILGRVGEATMAGAPPMLSSVAEGTRANLALRQEIAQLQAARTAATRTAVTDARLEDLAAMNRLGIREFGPAVTETGTAGTVRQLSEAPIVGAPVRNALEETLSGTRDAAERIAQGMGDANSFRDAGNVARTAIDRYADARSADVIGDTARNLTDEQLADVVAQEARNTSVRTRQDAMYESAWRDIPEDMAQGRSRADTSRFLGGFPQTRQLLLDLADRNASLYSATRGNEPVDPRLAYPVQGGIAGRIVEDIIDGRWRGNLQAMRDVRSTFRRLASGIAGTEANTLKTSDYARIQSAMTQDLIGVLQRNVDRYRAAGDEATAARVESAIGKFRDADTFTRQSAQHMEALEKFYNAQSPEALGLGIWRDLQGGRKGGNFDRLQSLMGALRDDERGDVAAGIFREMGRPMGSARGMAQQLNFSIQSWLTNWRNMSPEGQELLFRTSRNPALRDFVRVADRMANFEAMANTSRSATNALGMSGLASIFVGAQQALMGHPGAALGAASVGAGMWGFGKLLTSPLYTRWLTRTVLMSRSPQFAMTLRDHARGLAIAAMRDPDPARGAIAKAIAVSASQYANQLASQQGRYEIAR